MQNGFRCTEKGEPGERGEKGEKGGSSSVDGVSIFLNFLSFGPDFFRVLFFLILFDGVERTAGRSTGFLLSDSLFFFIYFHLF